APSQHDLVLAAIAGDYFDDFFAYPSVAGRQTEAPDFASEEFVRRAAGTAIGLRDTGTADERIAGEALAGRPLALNGDKARGRRHVEAALADAVRSGWSDARASGILRDLAWLARDAGETTVADSFGARAEVCALPCADDAIAALRDAAVAADAIVRADD